MTYDWNNKDNSSQSLSNGFHKVRMTKVMHNKKDGTPYTTQKGDPQILVVIENDGGEQGIVMFTLSERASWVLAKYLSCAGADMQKMNDAGVEPGHFLDAGFAVKQLIDRELWVCVEPQADNKYPKITPCYESDVPPELLNGPAATTDAPEAITEDEIPF